MHSRDSAYEQGEKIKGTICVLTGQRFALNLDVEYKVASVCLFACVIFLLFLKQLLLLTRLCLPRAFLSGTSAASTQPSVGQPHSTGCLLTSSVCLFGGSCVSPLNIKCTPQEILGVQVILKNFQTSVHWGGRRTHPLILIYGLLLPHLPGYE